MAKAKGPKDASLRHRNKSRCSVKNSTHFPAAYAPLPCRRTTDDRKQIPVYTSVRIVDEEAVRHERDRRSNRAVPQQRALGAAQRPGKSHKLVSDLPDPINDSLVADSLAIENMRGGKREARDNNTTKIEHETVGVRHHRHVTALSPGGA